MNRIFFKPTLTNLSIGGRIEYLRSLKGYSVDNIVEYFGWKSEETYKKWIRGERKPLKCRNQDIADLFCVSVNAIKEYDYNNPIDLLYHFMWLEEEFPYCEFTFDPNAIKYTDYNSDFIYGLNKWKELREKREKGEITDEEYIELKLNLEL